MAKPVGYSRCDHARVGQRSALQVATRIPHGSRIRFYGDDIFEVPREWQREETNSAIKIQHRFTRRACPRSIDQWTKQRRINLKKGVRIVGINLASRSQSNFVRFKLRKRRRQRHSILTNNRIEML